MRLHVFSFFHDAIFNCFLEAPLHAWQQTITHGNKSYAKLFFSFVLVRAPALLRGDWIRAVILCRPRNEPTTVTCQRWNEWAPVDDKVFVEIFREVCLILAFLLVWRCQAFVVAVEISRAFRCCCWNVELSLLLSRCLELLLLLLSRYRAIIGAAEMSNVIDAFEISSFVVAMEVSSFIVAVEISSSIFCCWDTELNCCFGDITLICCC